MPTYGSKSLFRENNELVAFLAYVAADFDCLAPPWQYLAVEMAAWWHSVAVNCKPLAELVSFLETLPEPHILCDRDYRILAANEAYRANWIGQAEVLGRKCFEVSHRYTVPCDQAGESCPLQRSLRSGKRERVLHLHYTSRGESLENCGGPGISDSWIS